MHGCDFSLCYNKNRKKKIMNPNIKRVEPIYIKFAFIYLARQKEEE